MIEPDDASSNPNNDEHLPGAGESATRDDNVPLDPAEDSDTPYQDDLDTDESKVDPIMDEETDDPTEELGVPPEEFKRELDSYDVDDGLAAHDDRREAIEDRDEADDNAASAPQ